LLPEYEGVLESDLSLLLRGTMLWPSVSLLQGCLRSAFRQVPSLLRSLVRGSVEPITPALSEQSYRHKTHLTYVKKIRRQLENITLPTAGAEKYDRDPMPSLSGQEAWTAKQRIVHKILTELGPSSVLDLSTNRGWYSRLA